MRHPSVRSVKDSIRVGSWTARRASPTGTRCAGTAPPRSRTTLPRMAPTRSSIAPPSHGGGRSLPGALGPTRRTRALSRGRSDASPCLLTSADGMVSSIK